MCVSLPSVIENDFIVHRKKYKFGKVKLDLAKICHNLLVVINKYCDGGNMVKVCYADVNCRIKVKGADGNEENTFFSCMDDLVQMTIS